MKQNLTAINLLKTHIPNLLRNYKGAKNDLAHRYQLQDDLDTLTDHLHLPHFTNDEIQEIFLGLQAGLDISFYLNPDFNWAQMEEIRRGLKKNLNVSAYADPTISWRDMMVIRKTLENQKNETKPIH